MLDLHGCGATSTVAFSFRDGDPRLGPSAYGHGSVRGVHERQREQLARR
jgi:hypothetical protein